MESYTKKFTHRGQEYTAKFIKRPFREGMEVTVDLADGQRLHIAEFGLGEQALLEKLIAELEKKLKLSV